MDIFEDEFLAYLELKQDMLFHKIPSEQIPYYVKESLRIGREFAEKLKVKNVAKLYQEHQIDIKKEKHDGVFFKVQLRAQFETDRSGHNQVYLYQQSIKSLAEANQLTLEEMTQIILAHEFFHYLESSQNSHVSESLKSIETMRFFTLVRKAKIRRTSEIAANAFAKKMLGLAHLPSYYDYQYLLSKQEISLSALKDEYAEYQAIFKV